ncbi:hypothetical protein AVEN_67243-1 [Araneus ventricosus]|uniref:Tc1-like transposase DDE domain-containing protein n=1 Tax=Araneus ventricosus TaxID=182803 RepID=A0A4Y2W969_ARAVE|nr:hypothetical protein AVEN_67243-1 [Araneus ventricosus]
MVIWSDESSFTLFQTTGRVFVWRTPAEAFHVDCLVSTVKHGGGSVLVWGAISCRGLGHSHCFLENVLYSKMTTPLYTARCVQTWLDEHNEVEHLTWCPQYPDLNIIEPLWGFLENKVHARFPPPLNSRQLCRRSDCEFP